MAYVKKQRLVVPLFNFLYFVSLNQIQPLFDSVIYFVIRNMTAKLKGLKPVMKI